MFTLNSDKSNRKRIIGNFFVDTLHRRIYHQLCKVQRISCLERDFILQFKVFAKNIKETAQAKYFIKATAHHSSTRLRVIRRINIVH